MSSIYVIEDEDNIRELVFYALKSEGYKVVAFEGPVPFWKHIQLDKPSLILLDVMLPGESGFEVLRSLKQAKDLAKIPVILLTALKDECMRIRGLDSGADDYITKPFNVDELLARVRAVLRRVNAQTSMGELILNPESRTVLVQGQEIDLTFLEFELLHCLIRHKDIALSRDQILDLVWKPGEEGGPSDRNVDMQVRGLRKKLGTCGDMIKTVRGVGYKVSGYS